MADFDYKSAWRELAQPSFMALPNRVQELIGTISDYPEPLRQGSNLDVPMPADLSPLFDAIDTPTLAAASRIVNFFGYWAPSGSTHLRPGVHWQFSNLADQVLRKRIGLGPRDSDGHHGVSVQLHEGILRICIGTEYLWTWDEIAPATPENLGLIRLRQSIGKPSGVYGRTAWDKWADGVEATSKAIKAELGPWNGLLAGWDNTDRFMR